MFRKPHIVLFLAQSDNPYKILGVKSNSSKIEIKKAYRSLAAVYHPDAPGGNKDKFQRISSAYEQVKDGIYIPKSNGGSDGNTTGDRYANFRYTTAGSRGVRSYESFYKEMHMRGKFDKEDFAEFDKRSKRNYVGDNPRVQAWFRLVLIWSSFFLITRILLLILFPPGAASSVASKGTGGDFKTARKPPPPKPLPGMSPINPVY
ncbi:DnaJ chaperone [Perkinsela sp. CCAP 1560/4]|nr:DnaJ chaperone [Perkinsela sp. CCAP 1560/4]|eukprot:KNH08205.1 DnaJ chaperone [Perkinsela sp. CCAP 1560/4]